MIAPLGADSRAIRGVEGAVVWRMKFPGDLEMSGTL